MQIYADKLINHFEYEQNFFSRHAFINKAISKYNNCKYLEIGCETNICFNSIIANNKKGVDPNSGGTIKTTSNEFFKNNKDFYDVIFIDGYNIIVDPIDESVDTADVVFETDPYPEIGYPYRISSDIEDGMFIISL